MNWFKKILYKILPVKRRRIVDIVIPSTGFVKNPVDERDFIAGVVESRKFPERFDIKELVGPIENQGIYNSCVPHGILSCIEALARRDGQEEVFELSRMHLWSLARQKTYGRAWQVNQGVYVRSAWEVLRKEAVTIEKLFPYVDDNAYSLPRKGFTFAWYPTDFKYYFISDKDSLLKEEKIKDALYNKRVPVVFGIRLPDSFSNIRIHSTAYEPRNNDYLTYSHLMTIVGWDDSRDAFLVRNSWGTRFGNSGYFWAKKSWLLENAHDISYANR